MAPRAAPSGPRVDSSVAIVKVPDPVTRIMVAISAMSTIPYGAWPSPLSAARVTAGALRFDQIQLNGTDVYWIEGRASEGGRNVIVRRSLDGSIVDMTPAAFNVRSRVHEYGGGAYTVH